MKMVHSCFSECLIYVKTLALSVRDEVTIRPGLSRLLALSKGLSPLFNSLWVFCVQ